MITNNTKRAIWRRGTMAFMMEFRTTCKPKKKNKVQDMNHISMSYSIKFYIITRH